MSVSTYDELKAHIGHRIVCCFYGSGGEPDNVALECEDCNEVLKSCDRPRRLRK